MKGKTSITSYLASASRTRTCFVCEEVIDSRTVVLQFKESDGQVRLVNEIAMHPECASYLKESLP